MFYIRRIYLKEVGELINKKDSDTIEKWCNVNNVTIYKDDGFHGQYVFKHNLDLAYDMPLIKNLQNEYPDTWKEIYEMCKKGEIQNLIDFNDNDDYSDYTPISNSADDLF